MDCLFFIVVPAVVGRLGTTQMMNSIVVDSRTYINKHEMADRMGVTPRTIEHWMSKGLVPYRKIARTVRFDWLEVQEYLRKGSHFVALNSKTASGEGVAAFLRQRASEIRKAEAHRQ